MEDTIKNIPDVSFIDGLTLEDLQNQMISDFTTKYREITGKDIELPVDPVCSDVTALSDVYAS